MITVHSPIKTSLLIAAVTVCLSFLEYASGSQMFHNERCSCERDADPHGCEHLMHGVRDHKRRCAGSNSGGTNLFSQVRDVAYESNHIKATGGFKRVLLI